MIFTYIPCISRTYRAFHVHTVHFTCIPCISRAYRAFHVHTVHFTYIPCISHTYRAFHIHTVHLYTILLVVQYYSATVLDTTFFIADQIIIYVATPPNEPRQCILTRFNYCKFSKAQILCSLRMVFFTPKHVGAL
jgi:hypothetical protein